MSFRPFLRHQALCALALGSTSCADAASPGALGNGAFGYRCISDRDPVCSLDANFANGDLREMPTKVAVGASFGVEFRAESSSAQDGSAVVKPVSTALLGETSEAGAAGWKAQKPGAAGLYAVRGSTVVDVIHVVLVDVDRVLIDRSESVVTSTRSVEIGPSAVVTLSAAVADASGEVLAGSLDASWASDDAAVAEIITPPTTDQIRVRAVAPGTTTVRASVGGKSSAVLIKVVDIGGGSGGGGGAGGAP